MEPPEIRDVIVVHYGELSLKGRNRHLFEDRLVQNILAALSPDINIKCRKLYGRLVLQPENPNFDFDAIAGRLEQVYGIASFAPGAMAPMSWENLLAVTDHLLPDTPGLTFGVRSQRADAGWPKGRTETSRDLGAYIVEKTGWGVNLTDPDLWVRVEFANRLVLATCGSRRGARGLPVGVSGRVMVLLSGGIDSPVAAAAMMSRGCEIAAVHFHSAPYTKRASQDKVVELARQLLSHQPRIPLAMVPFADLQREIVQRTPAHYRVLLYRRFMMRIASALAWGVKAKALVTGESLGQVASQTLANMHSVEAAARHLVLRPLVGTDKETIMDRARALGTYDISIQPHDDCCSYLMPRRPATRSKPGDLDDAESDLDIGGLVRATLDRVEHHVLE